MYKVIYSPVYTGQDGDESGVLFEGDKHECEKIYGVLIKVKAEHKIEIISPSSFLSDHTRELAQSRLEEGYMDGMWGDGQEREYVRDGINMTGVNDMDDHTILDQLEMMTDEDEELTVKAKQELEEYKLLNTEG